LEVDRLPNHPADWIPFDKEMTLNPHDYGMEFSPCYRDFYHENYDKMQGKMRIAPADEILSAALGADCSNGTIAKTAMDKLYNTIMLLKEGGNTALSAGNVHLAARRYDKAIRYSAVAFMWFPERNLVFVTSAEARDNMQKGVGMGFETRWTPLLKLFVTVRLNLALATLRPEIDAPTLAKEQASIALHALKPFAKNKGKVMVGRKLDKEREQDEPRQTYIDAKELEVKAYFRLGSAQSAVGDYAAAIRNFGQSIQCRKDLDPDAPSEPLILRRIAEAKKGNTRKKERQRKKFKFAFADGKEEGEKGDGDAIEE
jgi:tetratricopeptide (TPR) repeat protein